MAVPGTHGTLRSIAWWGRSAPAVLRRPRLWPVAVRTVARLAPDGWYRRPPFLPVPARDYLAFRLQTMYGSADHRPEPDDLVRWLMWCRNQMVNRPAG